MPLEAWLEARVPDLHSALAADLVVGNFEACVSGAPNASPEDAKICLETERAAVLKLREVGVDFVSVANNHVGDFGQAGARHTIDVLQDIFGEDHIFGWRGKPSALLAPGLRVVGACFPETNPLLQEYQYGPSCPGSSDDGLGDSMRSGEELVAFVHWGEEHIAAPCPELQERARTMLTNGATHVIGSHSHVTGMAERVGRSVVFYSLGNFIFGQVASHRRRQLARNKRSIVPVFIWDGKSLEYEGYWRSRYDGSFAVEFSAFSPRLPRQSWRGCLLRAPLPLRRLVYERILATRWVWLSIGRLLEGVERPGLNKVKTMWRMVVLHASGRT